jgi:hypothetical protein
MAMIAAGRDVLFLKRASASRLSGEWSNDDYDALAEGAVVGRIFKANAAPVGPRDVDAGFRAPQGSHADARLCFINGPDGAVSIPAVVRERRVGALCNRRLDRGSV